jgi:hypothetical protein
MWLCTLVIKKNNPLHRAVYPKDIWSASILWMAHWAGPEGSYARCWKRITLDNVAVQGLGHFESRMSLGKEGVLSRREKNRHVAACTSSQELQLYQVAAYSCSGVTVVQESVDVQSQMKLSYCQCMGICLHNCCDFSQSMNTCCSQHI